MTTNSIQSSACRAESIRYVWTKLLFVDKSLNASTSFWLLMRPSEEDLLLISNQLKVTQIFVGVNLF